MRSALMFVVGWAWWWAFIFIWRWRAHACWRRAVGAGETEAKCPRLNDYAWAVPTALTLSVVWPLAAWPLLLARRDRRRVEREEAARAERDRLRRLEIEDDRERGLVE